MPKIRIDWGFLGMAFDSGDGMLRSYLDRQTGEVITGSEWDTLGDFDEDDEDFENDDPLRGIDPDDDRYVEIPSLASHEGFEIMEDFARSVDDRRVRGALLDALDRRRPFRAFKDALTEFPQVRERWFEYHDRELRRRAEEWLRSEGIDAELVPFIDHSASGGPRE